MDLSTLTCNMRFSFFLFYFRVIVKGSTVAINHYRVCYTSMKKHLCDKNRAITDTEILKVVARITPRTRWFDETGGG